MQYIVDRRINLETAMLIETRIDEILEKRGRSFYWLSKHAGVSYSTLWRLKKGKALGINFVTLEKLCGALACEPGDLIKIRNILPKDQA